MKCILLLLWLVDIVFLNFGGKGFHFNFTGKKNGLARKTGT